MTNKKYNYEDFDEVILSFLHYEQRSTTHFKKDFFDRIKEDLKEINDILKKMQDNIKILENNI